MFLMHNLNSIKVHCGAPWNHDSIYNAHYEFEIKLFIHDTNICNFHSFKYTLILLLNILASLMASSGDFTPRIIT